MTRLRSERCMTRTFWPTPGLSCTPAALRTRGRTNPVGAHSSNRADGAAGVRGLKIVDIPFDPVELVVDLDLFRKLTPLVRPKLVALGASMTLFPFPLQAMQEVIAEWEGRLFFDGAHQLGLVAGGQFQDPLREGAAIMTASAGTTFIEPQSGITAS